MSCLLGIVQESVLLVVFFSYLYAAYVAAYVLLRNLYPYTRFVPRWGGHSGNLADNFFGQDTNFYSKRLLGLLTRCANGVAWIFSASG